MACLSAENLIMRMEDRSLPCNPYHVPIPCMHILILHRSQLQSLPLLAPHTCTPYWPTLFFGDQLPLPLPLPLPLLLQLSTQPCATTQHPSFVPPASPTYSWPLSSLPRSNPLPRVSISTSAKLEDATVVSLKGAGGHVGEFYGGFHVSRSVHLTPLPFIN